MRQDQMQTAVPDAFVGHVYDVLQHLYDYAYLERHAMATSMTLGNGRQTAASALRDFVLDAMEKLHPDQRLAGDDRVWRPYDILVLRYSDGYAPDEVAEKLHVSRRQFQRDHRKGIEALAAVLWRGADEATKQAYSEGTVALAAVGEPPPGDEQGPLGAAVAEMPLQLQSVKLGDLTASALTYAAALVECNGCSLALPQTAPDARVRVDVMLARQAILGAVSALSSLCGGEVRVRYGERPELVSLCVVRREGDDAQIAAEDLQPRAADVASLLEAQGGRLQISIDNRETTWELCLPRSKTQRVLVVDDNERFLRLFERFLAAEGYAFEGVSGPTAALQSAAEHSPDLIIVDVMMRKMDGWDLIQRLRMQPECLDTPIVVCSVLNEPGLARALGAQGYLKKPVSQTEVIETVQSSAGRV